MLAVGDLLEVDVKGGRITLTPKVIAEQELALALADVKRGRVVGPFKNIKAAIRGLDRAAKSLKK